MAPGSSAELAELIAAPDAEARELAWARFLETHSPMLLRVCRSVAGQRDRALDAYAFVLESLRAEDFRRLRVYSVDGPSKFTTWLVVVTRRLCLDHVRRRYGRPRSADDTTLAAHRMRRQLEDLVAVALDDAGPAAPDDTATVVETRERSGILADATGRLPPEDQLLLKLRFHDDLPAREIAALIGFPTPFHVYRRLKNVLARLRDELRRRGLEGVS